MHCRLDNGKPLFWAKAADLYHVVAFFRYYAGWADKLTGLTIPLNGNYFGCAPLSGFNGSWQLCWPVTAVKLAPAIEFTLSLITHTSLISGLAELRSNARA